MVNFELTKEKKVNIFGVELFRIKCTKTFQHKLAGEIKAGTLGGWTDNLNAFGGDAWVCGDAEVYGNARVYGDAEVYGKSKIDFILCSRFNFEFDWQTKLWQKLEEQFESELKKKLEKR